MDFSQFPNFNFHDQIGCLPEEVQEKFWALSAYLESVLQENERIHLVYPPNNEIEIGEFKNIEEPRLTKIYKMVYGFVVYGKPLA